MSKHASPCGGRTLGPLNSRRPKLSGSAESPTARAGILNGLATSVVAGARGPLIGGSHGQELSSEQGRRGNRRLCLGGGRVLVGRRVRWVPGRHGDPAR